mmetsp:Transcript_76875/g.166360  ORF Transcript_76875/g.166360 Transcript_76875/m.166360 type:complete len:496 (-) Transcript_76875:801-2288(-)
MMAMALQLVPPLELECDSPRSGSPVLVARMLSLIPESPPPGEGPSAASPPPASPGTLISLWRAKLEEDAGPAKARKSSRPASASAQSLPDSPVDWVRGRLSVGKASLSGASSTASTASCLSARSELSEDLEAASRRRGRAAPQAVPKTVPRAAAKLQMSGTAARLERHPSLPDPPRDERARCDPAARPASAGASGLAGKLRRAVSASKLLAPAAATPPQSRSRSGSRSRSSSCSFSPPSSAGLTLRELAQWDALRHLGESVGSAAMPLRDLAASLLSPLLSPDGAEMFTQEQISDAVEAVLCPERAGLEGKEAPELLPKVAEILASGVGLRFGSVAGQVLWQHRGLKIFTRDAQLRALVEDTRWAEDFPVDLGGQEILKQVDRAFKVTSSDGGHMRFGGWHKVIRTIEANPVLQARFKKTDADRLFWTACKRSAAPPGSMTRRDFRKVLLELSEAMGVHPYMVFLTVGSATPFLAEMQEKQEKERQESTGFIATV